MNLHFSCFDTRVQTAIFRNRTKEQSDLLQEDHKRKKN